MMVSHVYSQNSETVQDTSIEETRPSKAVDGQFG